MTITKDKYLSDKCRISIESLILRNSKRFCMTFFLNYIFDTKLQIM